MVECKLDRGNGGANTGIVGDIACIVLRDVQVRADKEAPTSQVTLAQPEKRRELSISRSEIQGVC